MTGPVAGPVASSTGRQKSCTGAASGPLAPMQHTHPPLRISTRYLSTLQARLSTRDHEVTALVARLRVMSSAQLTELFWPDGTPATRARLARKGLRRLCELGVLESLARRVGGVRAGSAGMTFAVGRAGQRLLATSQGDSTRRVRRAYTPGARYLAHTIAISQLYVELVTAQRWGVIDRLQFEPEPECWRSYPGRLGARLVLKPDAYARFTSGGYEYSWFIERDMATEAQITIERKAHRYRDYWQTGTEQHARGVFPRVAWIAPNDTRCREIRDALGRLGPDAAQLFAVTTAADILALFGGGA
jgi:hypothetical protein